MAQYEYVVQSKLKKEKGKREDSWTEIQEYIKGKKGYMKKQHLTEGDAKLRRDDYLARAEPDAKTRILKILKREVPKAKNDSYDNYAKETMGNVHKW